MDGVFGTHTANCSIVSTPSAMVVRRSRLASRITADVMVIASASVVMCSTKLQSILMVLAGSRPR
jgi:hypothetical protein